MLLPIFAVVSALITLFYIVNGDVTWAAVQGAITAAVLWQSVW